MIQNLHKILKVTKSLAYLEIEQSDTEIEFYQNDSLASRRVDETSMDTVTVNLSKIPAFQHNMMTMKHTPKRNDMPHILESLAQNPRESSVESMDKIPSMPLAKKR